MPDLFVSDEKSKENSAVKLPNPKKFTGKQKIEEGVDGSVVNDGKEEARNTYKTLGSFNYYPHNVNFQNKDPEEKVILFLRSHPINNIGWIAFTFLLLILPPFITVLPFFDGVPFRFIILGALIWYLFTFIYAFEAFLFWFFSVNIITDERIFDFDFHNLTYRKVTDVNIDKIQDVTVSIAGGIGTMFNFGDVLVQTASEIPEIDFIKVPQPDKVAKILREMRVEEEKEQLEGRVR